MSCIINCFRSEKSVLEGAYRGKTVVITGAGRGIGRELAIVLARSGAKTLILGSRSEQPLAEAAGLCKKAATHPEFTVCFQALDVCDGAAVEQWKNDYVASHASDTRVHFVISNAGALGGCGLLNTSPALYTELFDTNFTSMVHTLRAWLPLVTAVPKSEQCGIINMSSMLGLYASMLAGPPLHQPYVAAKYAVRGLTESLILEMNAKKCWNIGVTGVYPGHIGTEIASNARKDVKKKKEEEEVRRVEAAGSQALQEGVNPMELQALRFLKYDVSRDASKAEVDKLFAQAFNDYAPTTAEECAREMLVGAAQKRRRLVIGFDAKVIDFCSRVAPDASYNPAVYKSLALLCAVRPLYVHFIYRKRVVFYPLLCLWAALTAVAMKTVAPSACATLAQLAGDFVSKVGSALPIRA
ncbi:putative oxidoreductase SadH [Diplonema papillatum]|nr:putative oxidoreductase SadH [Diplonema papillatum]